MDPHMYSDPPHRARLWLLVAITIVLVGWALRATGTFVVPIVFSVFLALLVAPLDRMVTQRLPKKLVWLGHLAAMGAILVTLLVFIGLIWIAAQQVVERFPVSGVDGSLLSQILPEASQGPGGSAAEAAAATGTTATANDATTGSGATATANETTDTASAEAASSSGNILERFRDMFSGAGGSALGRLGDWASGIAMQVLSAAGATLMAVVLVFFLTLIMLIEAPKWRDKIVNVLAAPARQTAMDSIGIVADRLRLYLLARTIMGLITAALYVSWLWIFGVDLLVVWALLAFLLNFIPTFGSLIAGVLPVIYAFVQKDFGTAFAIGAGIFVIEQVMGNYVDPRVQGRQVSLSSLVVLITLLVWSWIWGVAGAILAVPITITAMIVCAHIRPLRPFALMLSNASDMDELDRRAISSGQ